MILDISALAPWIAIAIAAISLWYSISNNRSKDTNLKIGVVAGKLDLLEDRVTIVENDLKHLPDKDTTHRLEIALGKVETEMGRLSERMKPIANMADRMQEAILEKVMS